MTRLQANTIVLPAVLTALAIGPPQRAAGADPAAVLIPAGTFQMGSTAGTGAERPVRPVSIRSFLMQPFEVTKAQWNAVYTRALQAGYTFDNPGTGSAPDHPVHSVSWHDAIKWCNARSEQEGLTPCYTVTGTVYRAGQEDPECDWNADGWRLPTEAEWEYACRAGTDSDFAGPLADMGWFIANSGGGTRPAGSKRPNAFGLYDMHGNIWEWCWDRFDGSYYARAPSADPRGPDVTAAPRIGRGGSWFDRADRCRSADRSCSNPDYTDDSMGFRPVRSAPPAKGRP